MKFFEIFLKNSVGKVKIEIRKEKNLRGRFEVDSVDMLTLRTYLIDYQFFKSVNLVSTSCQPQGMLTLFLKCF